MELVKVKVEKKNKKDLNKSFEIILFNDDVNTFDYVINKLVTICGQTLEQAEQFVFIAVESKPPHLVAVYNASEAMIAAGNRVADKNLALLAECRKSDKWIGYSEEITNLDLPRYNND